MNSKGKARESSAKPRFTIGVIGADRVLGATCAAALAHLAKVVALPNNGSTDGLDLLLLVLDPPVDKSIARLAKLQSVAPELPIILLSTGLDANLAVELVKCGAEDYLELPYDARFLVRKVERTLIGVHRPTIDAPALAAFAPTESDSNRRSSFRARVIDEYPAYARVQTGNTSSVRIAVSDLSLPSERQLGGMSWTADAISANQLPLSTWTRGTMVPFSLELPEVRIRIPGRAILVRITLPPPGPVKTPVKLGVQYTLDNPHDEKVVQRFWAECQRRLAGPTREQAR